MADHTTFDKRESIEKKTMKVGSSSRRISGKACTSAGTDRKASTKHDFDETAANQHPL